MLAGCAAPFPEPVPSVGDGYPVEGVPWAVAWPSDWLDGFEGVTSAGPIVGLRLEYVESRWQWRVRSVDPGRDILGETVTEPDRGRESLFDASTLKVIQERHVTLTPAEVAGGGIGAYQAARLSGEVYPNPRLIELRRQESGGVPVWNITTYDTDTGHLSQTIVPDR
ncbi:hypothetical protein [Microbacterium sp. CJ88]|uniref:hypothetical protein n=1 Tax=Microbacterium sp. CJ88 TaxID=3445672 RepID=UPI003F659686